MGHAGSQHGSNSNHQKVYKPISNPNMPPQNSKANDSQFSGNSTTAFNDNMYPSNGGKKRRRQPNEEAEAKQTGAMSCYQGKARATNNVEFLTSNNKRTKNENEIREKKLKNLVKQIIDSDSDE
jgi:hypothetical protein